MLRSLLGFLLALAYSMSIEAKTRTFDRLILEINGKSYSQRQIELYQALRTIALGEPSSKALPGPEVWAASLDSFLQEMMIYINIENDAEKMNSLELNSKAIRQVQGRLEALQAADEKWRDFLRRYQVGDREVTDQLIRMFKVQAFLQSYVRLAASGQGGALSILRIDPNAEWYVALIRATPHRLYDRARDYQYIQPFGG